MPRRTHYQVLGVQPDAEDLVIKAAYRALAQRYHPDKWDGDKAMAQQRMAEINAAYAVLSDDVKRREYDAELKSSGVHGEFSDDSVSDEEFREYFSAKENDWSFACRFYPQIKNDFDELKRLNPGLAQDFKVLLLESKRFNEAEKIKFKMRSDFIGRYFGDDEKVLRLVDALLLLNKKSALLDVNNAVRILGKSLDVEVLVKQFADQWGLNRRDFDGLMRSPAFSEPSKASSIPNTSRHTDKVYHCNNCEYFGQLLVTTRKKSLFGSEEVLVCPRCGNRNK